MNKIANNTLRQVWQITLSIVFLGTVLFLPVSAYAEDSLCAVVKIEIKQELTLERQAFDAHMRINNGLSNIQLENVEINVSFADEDGSSVRATSNSDDTSASFFIQIDSMEGISDVSGSGTIAPTSSADIHWLIIPAPGSGGTIPSGTLYYVGATLKYTLGGEEHITEVTPDYIFVKPQPLLILDYFLPRDVYADDAFTLEIEPSVPFTLGVRIKNNGHGAARHLKIDSAQPQIIENKQGLLIGFKIIGSTVNNQPATPSLLVDFGDIEAGQSAVGRWQMTTTLSGEFTEFSAEFYHADELGGELTSLIQATNTHFLVKDVLVDLPGRDDNRDFLADEGGVMRVYESHGLDTEVNDHSTNTTMQLANQTGSQATYHLNAPVTAGFLYVKLPDPYQGTKAIVRTIRSDGKVLPLDNVWLSKTRRQDNGWDYFINLFDNNSTGQYQITLDTVNLGPQPPVLQFIPDRSTSETQQISFLVEASDPNDTIPSLSTTNLPTGANFTEQENGQTIFDWTPVKGQAGNYDIIFTASDRTLETSQTVRITVYSLTEDTDGDGLLDETCEMHYFSNLDREGSGDFDGDGLSDLEECLQGSDPTIRMPDIIINEVESVVEDTETIEFIELYDGGIGNTSLDGLVVVLFNGELDQSYRAFDLDGFMTNAEGYFVIGGSGVTGADMNVPDNDWLADGTDAIALYMGDESDFPDGTAIITTKLLDALVYDTDDVNDTGLLPLLNSGEPQINEGGAGSAETHSNQRCENGTGGKRNSNSYIQSAPTPGIANNCQADMSLIITEYSDPINTGTEFSYTLAVSNTGPDVASKIQVVDTLPNGVTFSSVSGTNWTCNEVAGTVTCELATLTPGAASPITINVITPSTAGDISNQATVSAATSDSDTNNNSASETTTINSTQTPPTPPTPISYTLTINKIGNGTVTGSNIDCGNDCQDNYNNETNITLTATPDNGWRFDGWSGDCDNNGEVNMNSKKSCTATFTQASQPGMPQLTISTLEVVDESAQTVIFTVSRVNGSDGDLVVNYATTDGTATADSDYIEAKGQLIWTDGDNNDKTLTITIIDDAVVESDETFTFTLTEDTTGANLGSATVTIKDNDVIIQPGILRFTTSTIEIDESAQTATLTINRIGGSDRNIVVSYATKDDTAIAGSDYVEASGQLTWTDGDSHEQTLTLTIIDDTVVESHETFIVTLSNGTTGADLGNTTITIKDNDVMVQPGQAQLTEPTVQVEESATEVILTISRVNGSDGNLVVNYATTDGTAIAGSDYVETTGKLTWTDGDNNDKTLTIMINDDAVVENDEMFTFALSNDTDIPLVNATVFISDDDTATIIDQPVITIPVCPTHGLIKVTCHAVEQTLTDVTIAKGVSIANALLEGTIHNQGWVSSSTLQPGAKLNGGIVTGFITNQGTMTDFDFRGTLVKGGTLSGNIINNSKVGGTFQDIHLMANTRISGGQLQGIITGDIQAPARLEGVKIKKNSHLSSVVINNTVQLDDNVILGEGVRFTYQQLIPTDLELMALLPDLLTSVNCVLPTQIKRVDLSQDVLEPSEGILAYLNALPDFKDNNLIMNQETECGSLQLTIDPFRAAVQPLSIKSTSDPAALEVLDQQRVRFTTDTGLTVLTHPAVQAPQTLQTSLAKMGMSNVIWKNNGNLSISASDENEIWFSTRPDLLSIELNKEQELAHEIGLFPMDSHQISGAFTTYYLVFIDKNGKHRQQYFYSVPAIPEILYSTAQQVIIESDGLVSFKLDNQSYRGVIDYLVTKGTPPDTGILQIEAIADMNGDGIEDWMLIYPDGERQMLFQVKEVVECPTSGLITDFSKGEVWVNDECKPLPTTTGSDGPIVTKADGTSGTSDANFSGGWSENGGPYKSSMTYGGGEVTITQVIHFDPAHVGKKVDIFILLNLYFLPDGPHWYQISGTPPNFIMWDESPATIEAFETHTIVAGESKVIGPYNLGVLEGLPTSDAKFDFGYRTNNGTIITTGVPTTLEIRQPE
jgi:uncharacterized repeat protein (TIGR01451 family)